MDSMAFDELVTGVAGQRKTAQAVVSDSLREAILSGILKAGERLKQEIIAAKFGVSRVPVREALKQLEGERLVVTHPHRGAVVAELTYEELRELTEIRIALETLAIREAMPRITKDHLLRAEIALDTIDREQDIVRRWAKLDWEFHATLYSSTGWSRLLSTINIHHNSFDRYVCVLLDLKDYRKKAQREHRRVLEACRQGDTKSAVESLSRHIRGIEDILHSYYKEGAQAGP